MSLKKKVVVGSMTSMLLLGNVVPVLANSKSVDNNKSVAKSITIDEKSLENDIKMSKVLTYDELISIIAEEDGISIDEAKNIVGPENIKYTKDGKEIRATYRTLSASVDVTPVYRPTLNWYCETSESSSGGFRGILKILKVSLNRSYNGLSKQFSGDIYSKLENPNKIYYILNGDFYNNGTTTSSGGVNISVGGGASVSFSVSYASNHFTYSYKTGYKTF